MGTVFSLLKIRLVGRVERTIRHVRIVRLEYLSYETREGGRKASRRARPIVLAGGSFSKISRMTSCRVAGRIGLGSGLALSERFAYRDICVLNQASCR